MGVQSKGFLSAPQTTTWGQHDIAAIPKEAWFRFLQKVLWDNRDSSFFFFLFVSPEVQISLRGLSRSPSSVSSGCYLVSQERGEQMRRGGFFSSFLAWCRGPRRAEAVWGNREPHLAFLCGSIDQDLLSFPEAEQKQKALKRQWGLCWLLLLKGRQAATTEIYLLVRRGPCSVAGVALSSGIT